MRATDESRFRRRHVALAVLVLLGAPPAGYALPQGAQVVSGQVTVGTPAGGQLGIVQSTGKAIVDWRSFGIGSGEAVTLVQPGGGVALFRVTGGEASKLFGSLSATGSLFLSNPSGVLFGPNARADVGSLVATTLGMANADFLAGRHRFAGDSRAGVVNEGRLSAAGGGSVVLLGANVANRGTISAPQGTVALGAGSAATLDVYGNGLLKLNLTAGTDAARIDHAGTIVADGGVASAAALGAGAVINIGGVVRAQSLAERDGAIFLTGGAGAQIQLGSTLDASAGAGAAHGGRIQVGAERIAVSAGARLLADAARRGDGGTVEAVATDAMDFAGTISARGGAAGGNGGNAEVSGHRSLTMSGRSDLSAPAGATGTLLLDPGSVSIIDSAGNEGGPNQFGDAFLAALLANSNVTISTTASTDNGVEAISVAGAANVSWSTATTLTLNAGQSIVMGSGAVIRNTNAGAAGFNAIVLNANAANTATTSSSGIRLTPGSVLETTRGNIVLSGRGGGAGNFNQGVLSQGVAGNPAVVRTVDGRIAITGTGGAAAGTANSRGISIETAATIEATGSGSITLVGSGAPGTSEIGIALLGGTSTIRTNTGSLSLSGTGSGSASGIRLALDNAATIASGSGSLSLTGVAGNAGVDGIALTGATAALGGAGTSGPVTLIADRMSLTGMTGSTTGTLVLRQFSNGRAIDIGAADSSTRLGLSTAELAGFSAGRLEIGNANAGNLTVSQAYAPAAGTGTLALISGGTLGVDAALAGGTTRLSLAGSAGVRLGAALSSNAINVAATRAIGIRTPGLFDNRVGAAALATPNGSWAISLATPMGQNFNGLVSGNDAVWSNPVTSNVNPAGKRYSFVLAPTIFVDAGSVTKTYGDTLAGALTLAAVPVASVAGAFGGAFTDYATGTLSGSYTRASTGLAAAADVAGYALTVTGVGGLSTTKPGYVVAIGSAGTLNVTPRPVTLTPRAVTVVYGDPIPASGAADVTGGSLANGNTIGSVTLAPPPSPNAGSYLLSGSNAVFGNGSATNYTITHAALPNGLTVTQRPVSLRGQGTVVYVYGSTAFTQTLAAPVLAGGSLAAGDTIASTGWDYSWSATPTLAVGTYPTVSLTQAQLVNGGGTPVTANYSLTLLPTDKLITPRPLILTPVAVARTYGDANPAATGATAANGVDVGLVNGDTVTLVSLNTAATPLSNVGLYATTGANAVFGTGAASNYTISYADNPSGLAVTQRPLTLTPDAVARIYGDSNPLAGSATGNNLVNGDSVASITLTSAATAMSNVGSYLTSGSNAVFGTGLASNYTISYADNLAGLTITQRLLTLTPDAVARVYGDANPLSGTATGNNLVDGDSVASVTLASAATAMSNVGSYLTSGSNAVFGSGLASNYTISYADNLAGLTITQRLLTLTPDAVARVYGDANPLSGTATGNNLVNGDSVASVTLASVATATSNVGSYLTSSSNATFGSGLPSNYTITYADHPSGLTVTPRPLTLTPDTVSRHYGDPSPVTGAASATNLVNGDTVAGVSLASPATATSGVGSYRSSASNAVFGNGLASNYAVTYADNAAGLAIEPRPVSVAAQPGQFKFTGQTDPALTYALTAGNLVFGDAFSGALVRSPGEVPGAYPIAQGSLDLGANYTIAFTGAAFTVTAPGSIVTIDRTPVVGAPGAGAQALATLIAALPPTAAGPASGSPTPECVREALLDRDAAGSSRIVNRGVRLPPGVVDACR